MKAKFSLVMALAVLLGSPVALAQDDPAKPDAPAPGQMTREEFNRRLTEMLKFLASHGDQEAIDALKKAEANNGQIQISRDEAQQFAERARKLQAGGGGGGGGQVDAQELVSAIEKLAADGDEDGKAAKPFVDKARETGRLEMPQDLLNRVVAKARAKGLMTAPGGGGAPQPAAEPPKEEPKKPDMDRAKEAIKLLAKAGDTEAKEFIDDFRRTKKFELADEQARKFIDRAVEKNLLKPDPAAPAPGGVAKAPSADGKKDVAAADMDRVREAVRLLTREGDKEARNITDNSRRNKGDLGIDDEKGRELIERAVRLKLMKDKAPAEPGGAEKMPPQQMQNIIRNLAQRGDRTAKAILRKTKKDATPEYTDEEEKKLLESARKAGLIQ